MKVNQITKLFPLHARQLIIIYINPFDFSFNFLSRSVSNIDAEFIESCVSEYTYIRRIFCVKISTIF